MRMAIGVGQLGQQRDFAVIRQQLAPGRGVVAENRQQRGIQCSRGGNTCIGVCTTQAFQLLDVTQVLVAATAQGTPRRAGVVLAGLLLPALQHVGDVGFEDVREVVLAVELVLVADPGVGHDAFLALCPARVAGRNIE
ncbi:hypothetical protein OW493_02925 [Cobetia sp. 14N.309.X.WAT.E.A4]|uniref:hypothetical protein n=1 Tax=Cobetia sp. 14N.309.X.WAT.E.A4 TaxID=2998323 RepID=UPI0025B1C741|nr:hypothetical protein [Cobetia sp. 14N.309.X.WAT.E.A4]MDN2655399.1 hypothetical protein [Cobetia sp. 14N.309.X.WAT.E.A4]